jgi:hypothetical protein
VSPVRLRMPPTTERYFSVLVAVASVRQRRRQVLFSGGHAWNAKTKRSRKRTRQNRCPARKTNIAHTVSAGSLSKANSYEFCSLST